MEQWHVRKEVTLGTIVAIAVQTFLIIGALVTFNSDIKTLKETQVPETRVVVLETRLEQAQGDIYRLEARTLRTIDDIYASLRRIEEKVDQAAR